MIEKFLLSNGLRVAYERMPHLRSVSIGVWIKAGSMLETPEENGLSHLMEHMAFKGTNKRTARELAEEMDAIGGHMNAATSKLYTCYYAKVSEGDLPRAVDLLSDITLHSILDPQELEKEKNVVLEEIAMGEDSPEDVVYELMNEVLYKGQSLAQPIIGSREGVSGFSPDQVRAFRHKHYQPGNAVISVAGHIQRDALISLLEDYFGGWHGDMTSAYPSNTALSGGGKIGRDKKTEQVQVCIGYPGLDNQHKEHYTMLVLNTIFGGGVSSRLFQRIREELGLVYSIYSSPTSYPGCGDFIISAGATPKGARRVVEQVQLEAQRLLGHGISEKELTQAKAQLRTGYVLAQESAYSRMSAMGGNEIVGRRQRTPGQILRSIDTVSAQRVMHIAQRILSQEPSLCVVGRKPEQYLR